MKYDREYHLICMDRRIKKLESELALLRADKQALIDNADFVSYVLLEELDLDKRPLNALRRSGIGSVEHLLYVIENEPDWVLQMRNFGQKSLDHVNQKLIEKGYIPDAS